MLRLPLISLVVVASATSQILQAQDEAVEPSVPAEPSGAEASTPYNESFSSGEVQPTPPPEMEAESDSADAVKPELNPDDDPMNDPEFDSTPDKFRIGITGALEIPHIVNIGIDSLLFQKFGLSINRGSVTRNVSGIDVSMVHTDFRLRYHPWAGSFFAGVALGQHTLSGEKSKDITYTSATNTKTVVNTNVKLVAKANYIAPHIGWFAIWDPGFTMGLDLGWLIPQKATTTVDASFANAPAGAEETIRNSADYSKIKSDLEDSVESYAKKGLPFVTMLRMGWMF